MLLDKPEFLRQQFLFEQETTLPIHVFGSNTLRSKLLQPHELLTRRTTKLSRFIERAETCRGYSMRGGKFLTECKGYRQIGVTKDIGKFRKEFIANSSQFVSPLVAFVTEFIAVLH